MSIVKRTVAPDTVRLVEGLRDTGYTFIGAVADILDNSVAAGAELVHVQVLMSGGAVTVTITDSGSGMDEESLENAMKYGSKRQKSLNSLSKFGLGLKTASTSFSRRLTVMSAQNLDGPVNYACWDLDDVQFAEEWELAIGSAEANDSDLFYDQLEALGALGGSLVSSGTVVQWTKVDRLLKTKAGDDPANPKQYLDDQVKKLRAHLAMVFQRYLDPEDRRARHVRIWLNDETVQAWDPFCTKWVEPHTTKRIKLQGTSGDQEEIVLRAFVLPAGNEVTDDAYGKTVNISNPLQGIYLYREDRLIEGPAWLGFGAADTHLNALRIEVSFPGELDELFGIDVKKSKAHLDAGLVGMLAQIVGPIRRAADTEVRNGRVNLINKSVTTGVKPSENTIRKNLDSLTVAKVSEAADGSIMLDNNLGEIAVVDSSGNATGAIMIHVPDDGKSVYVDHQKILSDGVLWEPFVRRGSGEEGDGGPFVGVAVNSGHDWFRKTYPRFAADSNLVQSFEYLMFALAQAEMNNTRQELNAVYKELRIEVGQNLRKLVAGLPEPDFVVE